MIEEKFFDYDNYIQKRLKELDDLDERRYAKELLLNNLEKIFEWTEEKYKALEQRIQDELDIPWRYFSVYTTIINRPDYDPINGFWHPICEEDIKPDKGEHGYITVYLEKDEAGCRDFLRQGAITGTDKNTEEKTSFQIRKSKRYEAQMKALYRLFVSNNISWQTVHMGHLERFFDLVPSQELIDGSEISFEWGSWENCVFPERIPLWNIEKTVVQSQEFRRPSLDKVIYEHIYYLGNEKDEEDGYLVEADGDILSIRYEANKVLLKTETEELENVIIHRMHQGDRGSSYGYDYPVLSNYKKDNLAVRYLNRTGNFIRTPLELNRRIAEMSGGYGIELSGYEITDHADGDALEGDMNRYIGTQVFANDKRNILLFKFRREEAAQDDYLYESQIRYILSQLQTEFMEYKCIGTV